MNVFKFFEPNYKILAWFFVIFLMAQLYLYVIMPFVPGQIIQGFIGFLLNPASMLLISVRGVEETIALPIANTLNLIWHYILATIISKEIKKK
jgi:hypothetical protein